MHTTSAWSVQRLLGPSAVADRYLESGTARATAQAINADPGFGGHGPYRFNEGRTDYRFYQSVPYYRLVEIAIPEAISQWYVGSGNTVAFHTITGLATMSGLLDRRDAGELSFAVWPQETPLVPNTGHLLVKSYPAICSSLADYGPCLDNHQRDAWRVLDWILQSAAGGTLGAAFNIRDRPFGRVMGVDFKQQIMFEGWVLGVE
jgi:hypothetical protein